MEGRGIGEPSFQFLPKRNVWTEAQKEMRDDLTEYMMEDLPVDSCAWEGQPLSKDISKDEEGRKPSAQG
ncbi:hypothetical protein U1Q18_028503, partial [Sarracenia purpurea var. burkii]